jgi:hypothetical protein
LYCYDADGYGDCELIGAGRCWESETECTSESGTVRNKAWCEANANDFYTCPSDGPIGSCKLEYEGGLVCYEDAPQDGCEEYDGVFDSSNVCDTSIFSACMLEEEAECVDISGSFTKGDCYETNGTLVTPDLCELPQPPSDYSYCYDYDGDGECARLIGGCWAGSTESSCESMGGTVTTKEWCEENVNIINHCYTPAEIE